MSKPAKKKSVPQSITAKSITLVDDTGEPRIVMDAGKADGYARICLFAKDGRSIEISSQSNGTLAIALFGKHCLLSLTVDEAEDGQLSIRDRDGLLGATLGSRLEPGQHQLTVFRKGKPYWSTSQPKIIKKKRTH